MKIVTEHFWVLFVLSVAISCSDDGDDKSSDNGPDSNSSLDGGLNGLNDAGTTSTDAGRDDALQRAGDEVCSQSCSTGTYCSWSGDCISEGTCGVDEDCGLAKVCNDVTHACAPGGECGTREFELDAILPNMFITLDRSCSMSGTKWEAAIEAMIMLTTDFVDKIRFGFALFPDLEEPSCEQGEVPVPVGDNNESIIQNLMNGSKEKPEGDRKRSDTDAGVTELNYYCNWPCVTNIDTAILQASQEPAFLSNDRPNYVLLITDGKQANCREGGGDPGTEEKIEEMAGLGISTFVVGFGSGVSPSQLNQFAELGGVPKTDPADPETLYYQADDATALKQALEDIAGQIIGCEYTLDEDPPDPDALYVFVNDSQELVRNSTDGWEYDEQTRRLTFKGEACRRLQDGSITDIDVVFGCRKPTVY